MVRPDPYPEAGVTVRWALSSYRFPLVCARSHAPRTPSAHQRRRITPVTCQGETPSPCMGGCPPPPPCTPPDGASGVPVGQPHHPPGRTLGASERARELCALKGCPSLLASSYSLHGTARTPLDRVLDRRWRQRSLRHQASTQRDSFESPGPGGFRARAPNPCAPSSSSLYPSRERFSQPLFL